MATNIKLQAYLVRDSIELVKNFTVRDPTIERK